MCEQKSSPNYLSLSSPHSHKYTTTHHYSSCLSLPHEIIQCLIMLLRAQTFSTGEEASSGFSLLSLLWTHPPLSSASVCLVAGIPSLTQSPSYPTCILPSHGFHSHLSADTSQTIFLSWASGSASSATLSPVVASLHPLDCEVLRGEHHATIYPSMLALQDTSHTFPNKCMNKWVKEYMDSANACWIINVGEREKRDLQNE